MNTNWKGWLYDVNWRRWRRSGLKTVAVVIVIALLLSVIWSPAVAFTSVAGPLGVILVFLCLLFWGLLRLAYIYSQRREEKGGKKQNHGTLGEGGKEWLLAGTLTGLLLILWWSAGFGAVFFIAFFFFAALAVRKAIRGEKWGALASVAVIFFILSATGFGEWALSYTGHLSERASATAKTIDMERDQGPAPALITSTFTLPAKGKVAYVSPPGEGYKCVWDNHKTLFGGKVVRVKDGPKLVWVSTLTHSVEFNVWIYPRRPGEDCRPLYDRLDAVGAFS